MEGETVERVTVSSSDISSGGDAERLEGDLGGMVGIRDVQADPNAHSVEVTFDPREISFNQIKQAMETGGFKIDSDTFSSQRDTSEPQSRAPSGSNSMS
jgi:copper chaperone CopZ